MTDIRAFVFDLDGTLVQTEKLKALSYARATVELCPFTVQEEEALEAFKEFVGLSRQDVAEGLIARFSLQERVTARMAEFQVSTPWQAFVQIRLRYYNAIINDPDVLRNNQWAHNVDLLHTARKQGFLTALATMSHCEQANKVLQIIGLSDAFDFIATRDDVERGKPSAQIYELVARNLGVAPEECLVIEDSPSGVKSAVRAGANVIAVATPFTKESLRKLDVMDPQYLVEDPPTQLIPTVEKFVSLA